MEACGVGRQVDGQASRHPAKKNKAPGDHEIQQRQQQQQQHRKRNNSPNHAKKSTTYLTKVSTK